MLIDLHTHSNASDGHLAPAELARRAAAAGLDVIALTDHDTTEGFAEASQAGELDVICGIELSCWDGSSVHILGYRVDPDSSDLLATVSRWQEQRVDRAGRMVERLQAAGVDVTLDRVLEFAGPGSVGRPHVARAMVEAGVVRRVADAFTAEFLADGGDCWVPGNRLRCEDGIELIRRWGGVSVIAHCAARGHGGSNLATFDDVEQRVRRLVAAGLDGVEVEHPDHVRGVRRRLRRLAEELDLIATGGSDHHGSHTAPLGAGTTSEEMLERITSISDERRGAAS